MSSSDFKSSLKEMTAEFVVEMHDEWTEITLNVPAEISIKRCRYSPGCCASPAISDANIERAASSVAPEAKDLGGESGYRALRRLYECSGRSFLRDYLQRPSLRQATDDE